MMMIGIFKMNKKSIQFQYESDLRKLSKKYKFKRYDIAKSHIERLSALFYKLLKEDNKRFDIILAPGNSGLYMIEIAKLVYEHLKVDFPEYHVLPIYRDGTENNTELNIKSNNISEIMILDDEIMTGTSAKECINVFLKAARGSSHYNVTIVAENMYFEWHHRLAGVSIYFYAYARPIYGLGNNISHILPDKTYNKIKKIVPLHDEKKQAVAILLSGKAKAKDNNGEWYFDQTIETRVVSRMPDYYLMKREILNEIMIYVKSGIEKYKNKDIRFIK